MSRPAEHDEETHEGTESATGHTADPERPDGVFDYSVIGGSTAIVALTFYLAFRYLVWPGEQEPSHIKRTILEEES